MNTETTAPERRILKRYSAQERERLIKEYEASGQKRQEFCEERNVKLTTFHGWFKKAKQPVPGFAEVEVACRKSAPIEIGLPNGKMLGIYLNGKQDELAALIRGILGC